MNNVTKEFPKRKIIKTRFAPSPTGPLHIGGARTALLNFLLAEQNKGEFILRFEDTDILRNKENLEKEIVSNLDWLGLKRKNSFFRQSERLEIYRHYLDELLNKKKAYYCFCTSTELEGERKNFLLGGKRNYQYSRKCLELNNEEKNKKLREANSYVVRFFVEKEKDFSFFDLVKGKINCRGVDLEDFIISRSNNIPLFNFACAIDDYLMEITHVVRGEDHLSNTHKQIAIYRAFGWEIPFFVHLPFVLNEQGKKLSKRDKDTSDYQNIGQLEKKGYLPEALVNYFFFLGCHPGTGNTREIFDYKELIEIFEIKNIQKSGSVFSVKKLNWFNRFYISQLNKEKLLNLSFFFLKKKYNLDDFCQEKIEEMVFFFKDQINCFDDLLTFCEFFFLAPKKNFLSVEEKNLLFVFQKEILEVKEWTKESIKQALEFICRNPSFKNKDKKFIYHLLRRVITGKEEGPELAWIVYVIGQNETKKRIKKSLDDLY